MTPDEEAREWLEGVRRRAGPDADRASAILRLLDEATDDACRLEAIAERRLICDDMVDAVVLEAARYGWIRSLCVQAGILAYSDYETDITPLVAMFLPS